MAEARFTPIAVTENDSYLDAASEVAPVAARVIEANEIQLSEIAVTRIRYLFSKKVRRSKGREILGSSRVCSEKEELYHSYEAEVMISLDFWQSFPDRREPLLFHELLHFYKNADGELKTRGHDLEEFAAVVRKYGLWDEDTEHFAGIIQQLTLDDLR